MIWSSPNQFGQTKTVLVTQKDKACILKSDGYCKFFSLLVEVGNTLARIGQHVFSHRWGHVTYAKEQENFFYCMMRRVQQFVVFVTKACFQATSSACSRLAAVHMVCSPSGRSNYGMGGRVNSLKFLSRRLDMWNVSGDAIGVNWRDLRGNSIAGSL